MHPPAVGVRSCCQQPSKHGGTLADRSVRNALKPLRIVLATARREGLIAHNPASEAVAASPRGR